MNQKDSFVLAWKELLDRKALALFPEHLFLPHCKEKITQANVPPTYKALLHLWNDDIESCHLLVQKEETNDNNHLHAICHRKEKDFSNALYWYSQITDRAFIHELRKSWIDYSPQRFIEKISHTTLGEKEVSMVRLLDKMEMTVLLQKLLSLLDQLNWQEN